MRRLAAFAALVVFGASSGAALAQRAPADPRSSCVGLLTSVEATGLDHGFVGSEVSGLARSAPGLVGGLVSGLAGSHAGSVEECLAEVELE